MTDKPRYEVEYIDDQTVDIVTRVRVPISQYCANADQLRAMIAKPIPGNMPHVITHQPEGADDEDR